MTENQGPQPHSQPEHQPPYSQQSASQQPFSPSNDTVPGYSHAPAGHQPPPAYQQQYYQQHSAPRPDPPPFPRGFWAGVDYMLLNRDEVVELLRRGQDTRRMSFFFFAVSLFMGFVYGAVMGATNLLQSTPMDMNHKLMMMGITALKVPALFIISLLIVLPPIYVSNAFVGAKLRFHRITALLFGSMAIQLIVLASMATVALFFELTSRSYHFIKLLHVGFFFYAGLIGLGMLVRMIRVSTNELSKRTPFLLFLAWLVLYGFVGIQLAWTLRPFIGSPDEPFQVFRDRHGNVIESLHYSVGQMVDADDEPTTPPVKRLRAPLPAKR